MSFIRNAIFASLPLIALSLIVGCAEPEEPAIVIVNPKPGAIVHPGEEILLEVEVRGGFEPVFMMSMVNPGGGGPFETSNGAPFQQKVTIPERALGEVVISVLAANKFMQVRRDETGTYNFEGNEDLLLLGDTITLPIVCDADIEEIRVDDRYLFFGYDPMSISATATFSDGVSRYLPFSLPGLEYRIAHPELARVVDGHLEPIAAGKTTLFVDYKGVTGQARVVVAEYIE